MAAVESERISRCRSGTAEIAAEIAHSSARTAWLRRAHSSRAGFVDPCPCCPSTPSHPQPIRPWCADPSVATVSAGSGPRTTGTVGAGATGAGFSAAMAAARSSLSVSLYGARVTPAKCASRSEVNDHSRADSTSVSAIVTGP